MSQTQPSVPSTPDATSADAQSRPGPEVGLKAEPQVQENAAAGRDVHYTFGNGVGRAALAHGYERQPDDPIYRPLKIYTLDPSFRRLEGATATINIPYEPLQPGPVGTRFAIEADSVSFPFKSYPLVNLEDPKLLMRNGRDPSPSDPAFHHQMVYAVCSSVYSAFRTALGRELAWGFQDHVLRIRPHAKEMANASYYVDSEEQRGELQFGWFCANKQAPGIVLPHGVVFTCLSHDVIAHELSHALLDGLRARFRNQVSADVSAFHEAFADLVAIFQHFSYQEVVKNAIRQTGGDLTKKNLLQEIAREFAQGQGENEPLRQVDLRSDDKAELKLYYPSEDPYALGSILVSAVFEAFITVYRRKSARYFRLATGGTGLIPAGAELPNDLQDILAHLASRLASQFLSICIRAIDYCPPIDIEFGEYLRALITADYDLVPDDPGGYREALIEAFSQRRIYPSDVSSMSEDALLWRGPEQPLNSIEALHFANLRFSGDPGQPADKGELERQAGELGYFITRPEHVWQFGCVRPGDAALNGDEVDPPRIESIRSSRRVGPNGQMVFDLVAEITQRRQVKGGDGYPDFDFYGGSTIILGPRGEVRYVIRKRVTDSKKIKRQRDFVLSGIADHFSLQKCLVIGPSSGTIL